VGSPPGRIGFTVRDVQVLRAAGHFAVREGEPNQYREHLRVADLSVGTYSIPVGGKDGQEPHSEDEIYVVVRGHGRLVSESCETDIGPGSVIYVKAGDHHQFTDVTEDLSVVVVFAPAERTRE
jgi:mannose-6-phosphate isomerase-like protein (cupin superfamily)